MPSLVDSGPNPSEAPPWRNMVIEYAMIGEKIEQCMEEFGRLREATARLSTAKINMERFEALGPTATPATEDARLVDIMSAKSDAELENKIRSHAQRDGRHRKVKGELDQAEQEFATCSARFQSAYDALVRHFAG